MTFAVFFGWHSRAALSTRSHMGRDMELFSRTREGQKLHFWTLKFWHILTAKCPVKLFILQLCPGDYNLLHKRKGINRPWGRRQRGKVTGFKNLEKPSISPAGPGAFHLIWCEDKGYICQRDKWLAQLPIGGVSKLCRCFCRFLSQTHLHWYKKSSGVWGILT